MEDLNKLREYIKQLLMKEISTTSNVPGYSSKYWVKPVNNFKKDKYNKVSGSNVLDYKIDN